METDLMRRAHPICFVAWLTLAAASTASGADKPGQAAFDASKLPAAAKNEVDFARDVRPLLESRCWKCHGETKHESGLSLHRREAAFVGGDSGKEFEPGNSAESRLIRFVSGLDAETVMR